MELEVALANDGQPEIRRRPRKVVKERVLALKVQGWRDAQIARKLGICRRSVQRVVSEHKQEQQHLCVQPELERDTEPV